MKNLRCQSLLHYVSRASILSFVRPYVFDSAMSCASDNDFFSQKSWHLSWAAMAKDPSEAVRAWSATVCSIRAGVKFTSSAEAAVAAWALLSSRL